jgi:hypothetical protein
MTLARVQMPRPPIGVDLVMGIDAGNQRSGFAFIHPASLAILEVGDAANDELLARFPVLRLDRCAIAIEMMHNQGKRVGREIFEACVWIGRFAQHARECGMHAELILRQAAKSHILRAIAGNDSELRSALVRLYGGTEAALGTKAAPGPLRGASSHAFAALAVARTFAQTRLEVPA